MDFLPSHINLTKDVPEQRGFDLKGHNEHTSVLSIVVGTEQRGFYAVRGDK